MAFIRGSSGGEPQLIEVYESTRTAFTDRVLEGLRVPEPVPPRLRAAARGWVAFTEEVTVDWLSRGELERDEVVGLIDDALVAILAAAEEAGRRPKG